MSVTVPALVTTQDRSGAWRVQINRMCSHSTNSPARFGSAELAEKHGRHLLAVSKCLTCAIEERGTPTPREPTNA